MTILSSGPLGGQQEVHGDGLGWAGGRCPGYTRALGVLLADSSHPLSGWGWEVGPGGEGTGLGKDWRQWAGEGSRMSSLRWAGEASGTSGEWGASFLTQAASCSSRANTKGRLNLFKRFLCGVFKISVDASEWVTFALVQVWEENASLLLFAPCIFLLVICMIVRCFSTKVSCRTTAVSRKFFPEETSEACCHLTYGERDKNAFAIVFGTYNLHYYLLNIHTWKKFDWTPISASP